MFLTKTLSRGVLCLIGLLFFSPTAFSTGKSGESGKPGSEEWLKALAYLDKTNAKGQFLKLKDFSMRSRSSDRKVSEYVLDYFVRGRDRNAINEYVLEIAKLNHCSADSEKKEVVDSKHCVWLRRLWKDSLSQLQFYDSTAPQLESYREYMAQKDCSNAKLVLEQIEIREGEFLGLLNRRLRVAKCLKDVALEQRVLQKLKDFEF
ncbi:hypothetical protein GW916_12850 [bacterium]|nr:hypothetical protein [bacterium]